MARMDDVILKSILGACEEVGLERGKQAFAATMAQSIIRLIAEDKLNHFQVMLALGWNGRYVYGNRIRRDKLANAILRRLRPELELLERVSEVEK